MPGSHLCGVLDEITPERPVEDFPDHRLDAVGANRRRTIGHLLE
jgi:hypothetical protein